MQREKEGRVSIALHLTLTTLLPLLHSPHLSHARMEQQYLELVDVLHGLEKGIPARDAVLKFAEVGLQVERREGSSALSYCPLPSNCSGQNIARCNLSKFLARSSRIGRRSSHSWRRRWGSSWDRGLRSRTSGSTHACLLLPPPPLQCIELEQAKDASAEARQAVKDLVCLLLWLLRWLCVVGVMVVTGFMLIAPRCRRKWLLPTKRRWSTQPRRRLDTSRQSRPSIRRKRFGGVGVGTGVGRAEENEHGQIIHFNPPLLSPFKNRASTLRWRARLQSCASTWRLRGRVSACISKGWPGHCLTRRQDPLPI